MRPLTGILLWLIATLGGIFGAGWFSLAGLGWNGGFYTRIYWDKSESGIGVALGVFGLFVWVVALVASFLVMRGGDVAASREIRRMSVTLTTISIGVVVVACALVLGWPEPPSEFPTPEWNRA